MRSWMSSTKRDRVIELVRRARRREASPFWCVRARILIEIVSALKRHRIAFQAIEIDQLGERPVIEDLMALTLRAAASRPIAYRGSPFCARRGAGSRCDDLHALAGARSSRHHLGFAAPRALADLSEDGRRENPANSAGAGTSDRRTRAAAVAGLGGRRVVAARWARLR